MSNSTVTTKVYDANRRRKTYPFLRRVPVLKQYTDKEMKIETKKIYFNNENQVQYFFDSVFTLAPIVTLTADDDNVNLYIADLTKDYIIINSSAEFTGWAHMHAIEIG
jgi:hypothetical protein